MGENELFSEKFKPSLEQALGDLSELYVYIDGRFSKGMHAAISVFDHGLMYGDGVYEGIRAYDGKVFKLDAHIARLYESAKGIGIEKIPLTKKEIKEVIFATLRKNNLLNAHIRPIITRGSGRPGLDPRRSVRPSIIVMAYPMKPYLGEKPVRLITSSIRRKSPHSIDSKLKCLNYLDNILAKLQAIAAGYDEALMLDVNSLVAEATGENIFMVKNGRLYTPHLKAALPGITRKTVIELAQKNGYEVQEKDITLHELYTADEVFLTGTAAEIVTVAEIDGRKIGVEAPGQITKTLQRLYRQYTRQVNVL